MNLTRVARRRNFQCLSSLTPVDWKDSESSPLAASAFSPQGQSNHYELETFFEGTPNLQTGMVVNLSAIDDLINLVLRPLESKDLALAVPVFRGKAPTAEKFTGYLADQIMKKMDLPGVRFVKLRLYAGTNYWVDVWP